MFVINEKDMKIVNKTISCKDCENISKVKNAGEIVGKYQIMHNGIKIYRGCYHGDWMTKIIQDLKGHHEPQEEKAFHEVLSRLTGKRTMIELGSNWAYYSMWFNSSHSESENIMIEPNSKKLEVGKANFALNNMTGKFENAFVSSEPNDSATFVDWDMKTTTIKQTSVDYLIEKNGLSKVDILHSDIQGAEYDMLLGAKNSIINKKINYFFISTHGASVHKNCLNYLQNNKYNILCSHSTEESFSNDGLIVASANELEEKIIISKRKK